VEYQRYGPVRENERPFTDEDFAKLPVNELRYEVIGGELLEAPSSTEVHQRVLGRLLFQIHGHLEEYDLGVVFGMRFDVHLSPTISSNPTSQSSCARTPRESRIMESLERPIS